MLTVETKGNVSEVKFLVFFPPSQKGLFRRRGREGKTKKETKDLEQSTGGLALVLRNAGSVLSAAQLPLQVLRPLGAPGALAEACGTRTLWGGAPGRLGHGKESLGVKKLPAPISRSNYDRLLQKEDLTQSRFSRAVSKGQQESRA